MEPKPALSVIVPCYNGLPFVLEAIESVLSQADDSVEVVVVDDGSTDGSGDAVARVFGKRVRLVRQANAGVAAARNRGLAEATGDLVIWLDADDRLLPETLLLRRRAFQEDPDLEMLVGATEVIDVDTGSIRRTPRACGPDYLVTCLLPHRHLPHFDAMTFRRSALPRIGAFDPALKTGEDIDFWIRAWAELRWRFLDEPMAWHRCGNYSHLMQRTLPIQSCQDRARVVEKNRLLLRTASGSDRPWRREYAHWAALVAAIWLKAGRRYQTARWALRAIAVGRGQAGAWPYKYLLESLLSPPVYRVGVRMARWLAKRSGGTAAIRFDSKGTGA